MPISFNVVAELSPRKPEAGRFRRMRFPRSAGILLHPTSLPGPNGIGELGPEALRFLDLLADAGVTLWQMLPLGPTGYGNSPYQCFSTFAGNPLLIHVQWAGDPRPGSARTVRRHDGAVDEAAFLRLARLRAVIAP